MSLAGLGRVPLTPSLAAEFDSEWEILLARAKQLAEAEQIMRTGHHPNAASLEDMQELIRRRLDR